MNYVQENIKPIAFVTLAGCIGYFFGSFVTGTVVGLGIVSLITLVFGPAK